VRVGVRNACGNALFGGRDIVVRAREQTRLGAGRCKGHIIGAHIFDALRENENFKLLSKKHRYIIADSRADY
jgi:hypothetical protein